MTPRLRRTYRAQVEAAADEGEGGEVEEGEAEEGEGAESRLRGVDPEEAEALLQAFLAMRAEEGPWAAAQEGEPEEEQEAPPPPPGPPAKGGRAVRRR